ncbi:MAG: TonB-dependent siderophore receptor [Nostoc sp.]|uniref:TonB-dependent siderophore receptor n=1 Tax=Nostoc sp. TaxID=1180 RepID=UPI002FF01CAA
MKQKQLVKILLLTSCVWLWTTTIANSQEIANTLNNSKSTRNIRQLSEIELPTTSAQLLVQSPTPTSEIIAVTGVKANQTQKGVEVILQTSQGAKLQITNRSAGNNFIADIPNAQLSLANGDRFTYRSEKPIAGITEILVTNIDANTIRVTVVGEAGLPTVDLFDADEGLIFALTPVASTTQAPPLTPEKPAAQGDEPIELVVTGEQDQYRVPNASTATKTDIPIRDIPASIQVIPRQVLEDQRVIQLRDAVGNVSGVTPARSGSESLIFRGFNSGRSGGIFVNGFKRYSDVGDDDRDIDVANIEQIEILKGPASVLYGQGEPGGILNITTKQPRSTPYYNFEGIIGNFDFYRPTFDISGPVNTDKTIRYRLNAAYQNSGSFIDFVNTESEFVAPVLSFDISKNTTLTLEGEYFNSSKVVYSGLPAVGTILPNPLGKLPRSRFLDYPDLTKDTETANFSYRLEHKFSDIWSIRNGLRVELNDLSSTYFFGNLQADNRTLDRFSGSYTIDAQSYLVQTDVLGKIQTGSVKHDLLFGLELGWTHNKLKQFNSSSGTPSIDIFNPIREPIQFDLLTRSEGTSQRLVGLYAQDLISIGDQLKVLLGGRFDFAATDYDTLTFSTDRDDNAFSPRVGVVYQPLPPVSLYASWSRSFQPASVYDINADNRIFEPTKGEGFEVGVKSEFFDGRLAATLAAYQITKQNLATADPNNPSLTIQIGEQRSQGIEFDLAGRILPGLNIIGSYSYINAEITKDNSGNQGNQPDNVPRHSASLWTTYEIQQGDFKGLGFGGGVFFIGDRQGDLANTLTLPSYVRTDAAIFYRRDNWRAALNFKNLFDVNYVENYRYSTYYGAPFTVQATVSISF